jgi:pimeloyl-ACP methyl ester carboxylesterase
MTRRTCYTQQRSCRIAIRVDAGWNVLYFNYRGSWGSPGDFSFTHCIEDAQSDIAYLRDDTKAAKLRSDPNTIVLIGHSMGGFVALQTGALVFLKGLVS